MIEARGQSRVLSRFWGLRGWWWRSGGRWGAAAPEGRGSGAVGSVPRIVAFWGCAGGGGGFQQNEHRPGDGAMRLRLGASRRR
jgi:hypothetical protein